MPMQTITENEPDVFSCVDLVIIQINRVLNIQRSSFLFYEIMNTSVMRLTLDELQVGAGVFSP